MELLLVHSGSWVNVAVMTVVRWAGILFVSPYFCLGLQSRHFADRHHGEKAPACLFPLTFLFWQGWLTGLKRLTEEKFLLILTQSVRTAYPRPCTFSFSASTLLFVNTPGLRVAPEHCFSASLAHWDYLGAFKYVLVPGLTSRFRGNRYCIGLRGFKSSHNSNLQPGWISLF